MSCRDALNVQKVWKRGWTKGMSCVEPESKLFGWMNVEEDDEDYEDIKRFKGIAQNYLMARYRDCKVVDGSEECRYICDQKQIADILISLLPPVNTEELNAEIADVMGKFDGQETVEADEFVNIVMSNNYWKEAGPLVVRELIFLDCLYHYYRDKQELLHDDDYNELKEQLTWEGSAVSSMTGSEALFVTAVANSRKGTPILSDQEYAEIKASLQKEGSWVTARAEDPLGEAGYEHIHELPSWVAFL